MRTLYKEVHQDKVALYEANGWVMNGLYACSRDDYRQVVFSYDDHRQYQDFQVIKRKSPWLIQRGSIVRPLNSVAGKPLSKAVSWDYMGSAEFEFGAFPAALRRMYTQKFDYQTHRLEQVALQVGDNKYVLRLYTHFEGEDLKEYIDALLKLQKGSMQLKERSCFDFSDHLPENIDVWFDIENDCIFSYDRHFMQRLNRHLGASFSIMNP